MDLLQVWVKTPVAFENGVGDVGGGMLGGGEVADLFIGKGEVSGGARVEDDFVGEFGAEVEETCWLLLLATYAVDSFVRRGRKRKRTLLICG